MVAARSRHLEFLAKAVYLAKISCHNFSTADYVGMKFVNVIWIAEQLSRVVKGYPILTAIGWRMQQLCRYQHGCNNN